MLGVEELTDYPAFFISFKFLSSDGLLMGAHSGSETVAPYRDLGLASVGSGRCREVWIGGPRLCSWACQPHVVICQVRLARRAEWRLAAGAPTLRTSQAGQMQAGTSPEPGLASAPASSQREPDPFH